MMTLNISKNVEEMEKRFRKIAWSKGGHIIVKLIFKKINFSKKYENHGHFFKWD